MSNLRTLMKQKTTKLSTQHTWVVRPHPNHLDDPMLVVFSTTLKDQVRARYTGGLYTTSEEYRVARDDSDKSKWRLDFAGMLGIIWEGVNNTKYDSPEEAAVALEGHLQKKGEEALKAQLGLSWRCTHRSPFGIGS